MISLTQPPSWVWKRDLSLLPISLKALATTGSCMYLFSHYGTFGFCLLYFHYFKCFIEIGYENQWCTRKIQYSEIIYDQSREGEGGFRCSSWARTRLFINLSADAKTPISILLMIPQPHSKRVCICSSFKMHDLSAVLYCKYSHQLTLFTSLIFGRQTNFLVLSRHWTNLAMTEAALGPQSLCQSCIIGNFQWR